MPEELYSKNESLDRIRRLLRGLPTSEAPNTLQPPLLSENESLSEIAELLAGTLEGASPVPPTGLDAYGQIFTSIINEAGSTLASGTWTAVPYAGDGDSRNATPNQANDRIVLLQTGEYMIGYKADFAGTIGAEYAFAIYYGPTVLSQSYTHVTLRSSGTYHNVSATLLADLATANYPLQLIVRTPTDGANFSVKSGQLWVKKI